MTLRAKLTPYAISKIRKPGRYTDGEGLALIAAKDGSQRWVFRYRAPGTGRVRDMGLGPLRTVELFAARDKAEAARHLLARGIDPLEARTESVAVTTLSAVLEDLVRTVSPTWRGKSSETQWRGSLRKHCGPLLAMDVAAVTDADIFAALSPIWHTKAETASRNLHRLERILDHARVLRLRDGENPCSWAKKRLGKQRRTRKHYEAVPLAVIPDLMRRLGDDETTSAAAFRLLILTAMRSTEVLGLHWNEIDFGSKLLNLPGSRMKAGVAFRIPLSGPAVEILQNRQRSDDQLVFPSAIPSKPLSSPTFTRLLDRYDVSGKPHGVRSTFAGWAAERRTPLEVIDASLAHHVGSAVTRAYVRGDFLTARRELLDEWAQFCSGSVFAANRIREVFHD